VTAILTALHEFHSVAHPINEFVSPNKFESGLLGLDQLKDLLLCEEVEAKYGMTTHDVFDYYRDAYVTLEFEQFAVGATDRLLEFRDSNKVFRDGTTFFLLEIFETVTPELQRATAMEDKRARTPGDVASRDKALRRPRGLARAVFRFHPQIALSDARVYDGTEGA
jgi:hypothetical protein